VLKAQCPRRVLDLGTGTGVLAIAAAKALHRRVLATDIDARSVGIAAANARQNTAGPWVQVVPANGFSAKVIRQRRPFDLILANILANPLRAMATAMAAHLAPGGLLILSGLLSSQAPSVIAAYRARGFVVRRQIRIEGWSSLLLCKAGCEG
jgi:ribosomal protein L11 methyltransferase